MYIGTSRTTLAPRIQVWICIEPLNPDGSKPKHPNIFVFSGDSTGIRYSTKLANQRFGRASEYAESWEEAVQIVQEQEGALGDKPLKTQQASDEESGGYNPR